MKNIICLVPVAAIVAAYLWHGSTGDCTRGVVEAGFYEGVVNGASEEPERESTDDVDFDMAVPPSVWRPKPTPGTTWKKGDDDCRLSSPPPAQLPPSILANPPSPRLNVDVNVYFHWGCRPTYTVRIPIEKQGFAFN